MEKIDFTKERVAFFKGLKNRTEQQDLFVLLAEKTTRNSSDEKKLLALIRLEKASIRTTKARIDVAKLINADNKAEKEAERKARNHRLIQQGLLFDYAGLERLSRPQMMGILLQNGKLGRGNIADWLVHATEFLATKEPAPTAPPAPKS